MFKNRIALCAIAVVWTSYLALSQDATYGSKLESNANRVDVLDLIIPENSDEFIAISLKSNIKGSNVSAERIMSLEPQGVQTLIDDPKRSYAPEPFIIETEDNQIEIVYNLINFKEKRVSLVVENFEISTFRKLASIVIDEYDFESKMYMNRNLASLYKSESIDSSTISFLQIHPSPSKVPQKAKLSVFDNNYNSLYSHDIILPFEVLKGKVLSTELNSSGKVAILCTKDTSYKIGEVRIENEYHLLVINDKGMVSETRLEFPDKVVPLAAKLYHIGDQMGISGYGKTTDSKDFNGLLAFNIKFSNDNDPMDETYETLDPLFFNFENNTSSKRVKLINPNSIEFDKYIVDAQGDYYITGQSKGISITENGAIRTESYKYRDFFIIKSSASGELLWTKKIPYYFDASYLDKLEFGGYQLILYDELPVLIFLDNLENHKLNDPNKDVQWVNTSGKQSGIGIIQFDENGNYERRVLDVRDGENLLFAPMASKLLDNELLFLRIKGGPDNWQQFGRMKHGT